MRSRLATVFTTVALIGGTGGAIAVGASGSHGGPGGGASTAQYKPGKGCGDKNHQHKKHNECKPKKHGNKGKNGVHAQNNHRSDKGKNKSKHSKVKGVGSTRRHDPTSFTG